MARMTNVAAGLQDRKRCRVDNTGDPLLGTLVGVRGARAALTATRTRTNLAGQVGSGSTTVIFCLWREGLRARG